MDAAYFPMYYLLVNLAMVAVFLAYHLSLPLEDTTNPSSRP
jgi:hypothetical protein